jgi:uncharacterized membrane protein YqjE
MGLVMAEDQSIAALFSDVIGQVSNLVRTEIRLAKAEVNEKLSQTLRASIFLVAGAVLMVGALYLFLLWLVRLLVAFGIPEQWSTLIVAVVTALVGYAVVRKGLSDLSAGNLVPDRAVNSLQKDVEVAKETVR